MHGSNSQIRPKSHPSEKGHHDESPPLCRNGAHGSCHGRRLQSRLAECGACRRRCRYPGKVVASTGEPLAGIPIKAHRNDSSITVSVYTDAKGEYSFPSWSDFTPGSYSVGVELPDFEHTAQPVVVAEGKAAKADFTLKAKPLAYEDATASEIIAGLPGTDEQKVLFSQCSNCHTLQWALQIGRPKDEWIKVIKQMAGRAAERATPGTYAFSQAPFVEPLADYLTSIRGPNSSDNIPFEQRPRPTDPASTNIVVTEYALPRGGERDIYMLRGDKRFVWPHDVVMDDKYAYYTDHFSYMIGQVNLKTGETKELPFELPKGAGREALRAAGEADGRPGDPGGGAHELQFDQNGNVIVGMDNGMVKYDPKADKFTGAWAGGRAMFGLDPQGNAWYLDRRTSQLIEIKHRAILSVKPTSFVIPKNQGIYRYRHRLQGAGPISTSGSKAKIGPVRVPRAGRVHRVQGADADVRGRAGRTINGQNLSSGRRSSMRGQDADVRSLTTSSSRNIRSFPGPSRTRLLMRSPTRQALTTRTRSCGRTISAATASIAST